MLHGGEREELAKQRVEQPCILRDYACTEALSSGRGRYKAWVLPLNVVRRFSLPVKCVVSVFRGEMNRCETQRLLQSVVATDCGLPGLRDTL